MTTFQVSASYDTRAPESKSWAQEHARQLAGRELLAHVFAHFPHPRNVTLKIEEDASQQPGYHFTIRTWIVRVTVEPMQEVFMRMPGMSVAPVSPCPRCDGLLWDCTALVRERDIRTDYFICMLCKSGWREEDTGEPLLEWTPVLFGTHGNHSR